MKRRDDDIELSDDELGLLHCSIMLCLAYFESALKREDGFLKTEADRLEYMGSAKAFQAMQARLEKELERRGLEME